MNPYKNFSLLEKIVITIIGIGLIIVIILDYLGVI
ncbi:hypothetical protein LCGC14_2826120 [marine sediment metagenome]|uniref:Uncharacterized protein n=1 Tax=marine sediment metagenome TaxID=412755 RepID=A0A0F8YFH8_9ZZZZ